MTLFPRPGSRRPRQRSDRAALRLKQNNEANMIRLVLAAAIALALSQPADARRLPWCGFYICSSSTRPIGA
jgi:hypothetical protein